MNRLDHARITALPTMKKKPANTPTFSAGSVARRNTRHSVAPATRAAFSIPASPPVTTDPIA